MISIHAPLRERREIFTMYNIDVYISIHAPLRERLAGVTQAHSKNLISIHAPLRERPITTALILSINTFQSTLPCGSDQPSLADQTFAEISIHAPLRERRLSAIRWCNGQDYFNPRSLAGATWKQCQLTKFQFYFNPRSLAGATYSLEFHLHNRRISIHAPLRERQTVIRKTKVFIINFNPRSLAGATPYAAKLPCGVVISIHAPLRERLYA